MVKAAEKKVTSIFTGAFSSFSANDLDAAGNFYEKTLGLDVSRTEQGLELNIDDYAVFIYPKDDHEAATFTVLNFHVDDIDKAVDELSARGVEFEAYKGDLQTDEKGVFRGKDSGNGPNIAWFKDPAGNFLSIIED